MRFVKAAILILILVGGCQCDDESTDPCTQFPEFCQLVNPVQVFVDVTSTTPQTGLIARPVGSPPAARLSTASGVAPDCYVTFEIAQGGGQLTSVSTIGGVTGQSAFSFTDANGIARVGAWQLGPSAGLNQVRVSYVSCTSPLVPSIVIRTGTFDAMGVDPVPASLIKVEGDQQTGTAGEIVAVAPKVLVSGQQNVPLLNVQVTFRVLTGGGSVNGAPIHVAMTDATGHAIAPSWMLGPLVGTGPTAGINELEAAVTNLAPVVFTATSVAGAPLQVSALTAPAGAAGALSEPEPYVTVTDGNGNPVPNTTVAFQVVAGGGSVNPMTSQTDAMGRARTAWTFGPQAGVLNRLTATVLDSNQQPDANVQGNPVTFEHTPAATGSIRVYVDIYGVPQANVAVSLTGPETRNGATDSAGVITFANLMPGVYTVTIVPPPGTFFNSTSQQVTVTAGATPGVVFEGFGDGWLDVDPATAPVSVHSPR